MRFFTCLLLPCVGGQIELQTAGRDRGPFKVAQCAATIREPHVFLSRLLVDLLLRYLLYAFGRIQILHDQALDI